MLGFGTIGRKRQKIRRLLAAVSVALLLGVQALSAAYLAHEAYHECDGDHCQICLQLQHCIANFQLIGSGFEPEPMRLDTPAADTDVIPVAAVKPPRITLISLKVRMDE